MFRLSRPLQSLCTASNARALNLSHKPAIPSWSAAQTQWINNAAQRSNPRAFSASAASPRSASPSLGLKVGQLNLRSGIWGSRGVLSATALAGLGLGLGAFTMQRPTVLCEGPIASSPQPEPAALPPPPQSSLKTYELGFGTVAGICAGVFIKKGAKALAFLLGGVFVLLQYFTSLHLVRVNWNSAESRFQNMFYSKTTDVGGQEVRSPPTVYSLWRWIVDFLTADFPPRATFIAGLLLGLRIG